MTDSRKAVRQFGLLIILLLGIGYALFEARRYTEGPIIHIQSPTEGEVVEGPAVHVTGYGKNLSYLYINGSQAYLNENGELMYTYTPPLGYTVLTAEARDRFGRSRTIYIPFKVK
jgi:hypothetical protein